MAVFPDFDAVGDISDLTNAIGAILTFVLVIAVLMLIICAITWAIAASNGHHAMATKARLGAWTAVGAAILAGAGVAWINWLLDLGATF